jgi:hypothetical protein
MPTKCCPDDGDAWWAPKDAGVMELTAELRNIMLVPEGAASPKPPAP